jgi:hypothetical protein
LLKNVDRHPSLLLEDIILHERDSTSWPNTSCSPIKQHINLIVLLLLRRHAFSAYYCSIGNVDLVVPA